MTVTTARERLQRRMHQEKQHAVDRVSNGFPNLDANTRGFLIHWATENPKRINGADSIDSREFILELAEAIPKRSMILSAYAGLSAQETLGRFPHVLEGTTELPYHCPETREIEGYIKLPSEQVFAMLFDPAAVVNSATTRSKLLDEDAGVGSIWEHYKNVLRPLVHLIPEWGVYWACRSDSGIIIMRMPTGTKEGTIYRTMLAQATLPGQEAIEPHFVDEIHGAMLEELGLPSGR